MLSDDTVRQTLSLMNSCGMYDSAGEFTFTVSDTLYSNQISFIPCMYISRISDPLPVIILMYETTLYQLSYYETTLYHIHHCSSALIQIGLPAKSGVSGIIIVVVPNVMGFCLYSPLVNNNGNSLRGMHFCKVHRGIGVIAS